MSNSKSTLMSREQLSDTKTTDIANILDSENCNLIAFTCDKLGNINCFKSGGFDLNDQQFKSIFSEDFIVSEGSNSVAIAGGSETRTFPV